MDHENRKHYIVTKHKTDIFEIADEVYGIGGMAGRILRENPGVYQLKAGMVLNLPENVTQKPETADQAMRLDFAGLKGYHREETKNRINHDLENREGGTAQREQVAHELVDFLKGSGLLKLAVEPVPDGEPEDASEMSQESGSIRASADNLEEQLKSKKQGEDGDLDNLHLQIDGSADHEQEIQTGLNMLIEG